MVVSTTAEFACCIRIDIRSARSSASVESCGTKYIRESRIYVCPHLFHKVSQYGTHSEVKETTHSEHSPIADTSLLLIPAFNLNCILSLLSLISTKAATAFATTVGFESASKSRRELTKFSFSTKRRSIMYILATQIAAVFRTYGSLSFSACRRGSTRACITCMKASEEFDSRSNIARARWGLVCMTCRQSSIKR